LQNEHLRTSSPLSFFGISPPWYERWTGWPGC